MVYFLPWILNTWGDPQCIILHLKYLYYYNIRQVCLKSTIIQTYYKDHYNNWFSPRSRQQLYIQNLLSAKQYSRHCILQKELKTLSQLQRPHRVFKSQVIAFFSSNIHRFKEIQNAGPLRALGVHLVTFPLFCWTEHWSPQRSKDQGWIKFDKIPV